MRPATAVLECRPWLPRYRALILAESGAVLDAKTFWRLRSARAWVWERTVELA